MPFRGISMDDEGSIIYDGEKFVVNHPGKVPDNFDPGDKPVVGLLKTHPSHPQNRQRPIPTVIYTAFDKHKADEHQNPVEEVSDTKKQEAKQPETPSSETLLSGFPQDMEYQPDISALGLVNFVLLPDRAVPIEQAANRPLSEGQKLHVDHLLSIEDDTMVRNMLIGIRRDGIPPQKYLNDYLSRFAEWGWDETSDERTLELLDTVRQSDWDKWLGQADAQPIESVAQDLANDAKLSLLQSAYNNGWFETPRIAVQLLNDESPEVRAWAKLAILEYEYGIVLSTQRAQGDNTIKGWSYLSHSQCF